MPVKRHVGVERQWRRVGVREVSGRKARRREGLGIGANRRKGVGEILGVVGIRVREDEIVAILGGKWNTLGQVAFGNSYSTVLC